VKIKIHVCEDTLKIPKTDAVLGSSNGIHLQKLPVQKRCFDRLIAIFYIAIAALKTQIRKTNKKQLSTFPIAVLNEYFRGLSKHHQPLNGHVL
jgi:hypothetical protein